MQRCRVHFLQVCSPDHLALWNALSCETLAGHLDGCLGERVRCTIERVRPDDDVDQLAHELAQTPLELLCISSEVGSLDRTRALAHAINQHRRPNRPRVVFGNQIPSAFPELFLELMPQAFVVRGEGEEALLGLVQNLLDGRALEQVPNLVCRSAQGSYVHSEQRTPELERLVHPARTDTVAEVVALGGNALLESSRGCSWSNCSYCTVCAFRKGRRWEGLPLPRVLSTMEQLVAQGVREFNFSDDEFLGGRDPAQLQRVAALADGIERIGREQDAAITFRIFVIPHTLYRRRQPEGNAQVLQLLRRLQQVGMVKLYMGIESGSPSQMARYRRGYSIDDLEQALSIVRHQLGVELDVGFIMFDPELTLEEMLANVRFFRRWSLTSANQWPFRHLAVNVGTHLHQKLAADGLIGKLDPNYLSCEYQFRNPHVGRISTYINELSIPPGPVFYALKAISKRQFDPRQKDSATMAAQRFVEQNAEIYLDLMEQLAQRYLERPQADGAPLVDAARQRVAQLVDRVEAALRGGELRDEAGFVQHQVDRYRRGEVTRFVI